MNVTFVGNFNFKIKPPNEICYCFMILSCHFNITVIVNILV